MDSATAAPASDDAPNAAAATPTAAPSWQESSGRRDGPSGYQFGDLSRSLLSKAKEATDKAASKAKEATDKAKARWRERDRKAAAPTLHTRAQLASSQRPTICPLHRARQVSRSS